MCPKSFLQSQRQSLTLPWMLADCNRDTEVWCSARTGSTRLILSGEMLLIVQRAMRHCFIFSIQREKQEENRDIVRRQRAISQQQMAKIGWASLKPQRWNPHLTALHAQALPLQGSQCSLDFAWKWKFILLPQGRFTQKAHRALIMLSCFSEWHLIFLSVTVGLPHILPVSSLEGSSTSLLHRRFSATLTAECFLHTLCTISDEMVFAKQGHRHSPTFRFPFSS